MLAKISQEVIASIMNGVNNAINDMGYVAVGYENTGTSLNIIIEPDDFLKEEQT